MFLALLWFKVIFLKCKNFRLESSSKQYNLTTMIDWYQREMNKFFNAKSLNKLSTRLICLVCSSAAKMARRFIRFSKRESRCSKFRMPTHNCLFKAMIKMKIVWVILKRVLFTKSQNYRQKELIQLKKVGFQVNK